MILYHFTSTHHLPGILKEGLTTGDVPVTPQGVGDVAVWFTERDMSDGNGLTLPPGSPLRMTVDKTEVRIRVKILTTDRALKKWPQWGPKRLERWWYDRLNKVGGHYKSWWLYFGTISPERFEAIEVRKGDEYVPYGDDKP